MTTSLIKTIGSCAFALAGLSPALSARCSDHLDTPTVIADPAADIGDLYAWMSPDGKRLNLVMDIVGREFSDKLQYVFSIDSGKRFGKTTSTTTIVCRFDTAKTVECQGGDADHVRGDAGKDGGITSADGRLRVFAGLRDDPFFNNVKGTREAYDVAFAALKSGVASDAAGCPQFDATTASRILDRWHHTSGGPARDFLAGWTAAALVVSVDIRAVNRGGPLLAIWSSTRATPASEPALRTGAKRHPALGAPIDRVGRTLTGNALIGPLDPEEVSDRRKEQYNRAAQSDWPQFVADIRRTLGLYDAFDGVCGNQRLANRRTHAPRRYEAMARLLVDDRLWVNSATGACTRYMAVELNANGTKNADCGGRTPNYDAIDVYRSLLVTGQERGVDDGVDRDDRTHSSTEFPFLAAPSP
ncbi:DUF4331 family protein [Luteimonas panaciterrae]|uniref:DUF4331 family protein n=1 Tax=Luteimonas panaciterrae TaxID=363885 RepID=UPI001CFA8597|nr:DUF4331 family protein [Luteimonas panaciterrae]